MNHALRTELFTISGVRGKFPQVFLTDKAAGTTTYVGDFEKVQELIEANQIPADVLAKNNIKSFDSVFGPAKN